MVLLTGISILVFIWCNSGLIKHYRKKKYLQAWLVWLKILSCPVLDTRRHKTVHLQIINLHKKHTRVSLLCRKKKYLLSNKCLSLRILRPTSLTGKPSCESFRFSHVIVYLYRKLICVFKFTFSNSRCWFSLLCLFKTFSTLFQSRPISIYSTSTTTRNSKHRYLRLDKKHTIGLDF